MTWTVYWTLNLRRLPTLIISALFTVYPECLLPAPIISLNSDSDSTLPTLCLKLVFELCLSDLHFVLIKLHMDPHASDSVLQKTSPEIDPAVFFHFTTEVSAQATILVTHQQQLTCLTLLTRTDDNGCCGSFVSKTPWLKHLPQAFLLQTRLHQHLPPVLGWRSPTSLTAHPRSVRVSYCNARCL